jgi:CubicO group peptidase (beta-lactamase class C family)
MKLFISSLLLFVSVYAYSQTSLVKPESEGLSSERLKQIDANIDQWIKEDQLNGATMIILRNGKIVYQKAFGFANKQQNIPMKTDNIFRIASMTKPYHQRSCHDAI